MANCVNDWGPVITIIGFQIPIIAGLLATYLNIKITAAKGRAGHEVVANKLDALTTITVNGFHSPPFPSPAPPAPPAPPGGPL